MSSHSHTSFASSLNPADWGRAFALAIDALITETGPDIDLFGEDLPIRVDKRGDGADITLVWPESATPET